MQEFIITFLVKSLDHQRTFFEWLIIRVDFQACQSHLFYVITKSLIADDFDALFLPFNVGQVDSVRSLSASYFLNFSFIYPDAIVFYLN